MSQLVREWVSDKHSQWSDSGPIKNTLQLLEVFQEWVCVFEILKKKLQNLAHTKRYLKKKHLIALMSKSNRSNFLICKSPDIQSCSFSCRSRVEFAQVHSVVSVPGEVTIGLFNCASTFYCNTFQLPVNHTSYYIQGDFFNWASPEFVLARK